MLCPLLYSQASGQSVDSPAFIKAIAVGLSLSAILYAVSRKADMNKMGTREAFASVTLSWIIASAIGALPYFIHGSAPTYADAFFEAMSGFTTTGSTILTDMESLPHGLLLWRDLTHWLGGMGIIVLTLTIMPLLGIGGFQLFSAEAPGLIHEKLTPRVQQTAVILWSIYVLLTVAETALLMLGGMSLFDAITHSMGTIATGGFSPRNASVAHYQSAYIDWVITIFMFFSGANFVLHYQVIRGRTPKTFFRDPEFCFYLFSVGTISLLVSAGLYFSGTYAGFLDSLRYGSFQVVSIVTTTGFISADYELWPFFPQALLFTCLFLGGCAGSTAGAIKQIRLLVLCRHVGRQIRRTLSPRAVLPLRVGKNSLELHLVASCLAFFALYMLVFTVGVFCVTLFEPDLLTAISAVATTLGNVGPGFGKVGGLDNFSGQAVAAKWIYSFLMLCGRLELYTVLILFSRAFWSDGVIWSDREKR